MRPKGPSLDLEPQSLARDFDVMVQQLQARILIHTQPYDSSPPKVRECADSGEAHRELSVTVGDLFERGSKIHHSSFRLVAKEFQREVQETFANPRQFGNAF